MSKPKPLNPQKLYPAFLKFFLILLGILLLVSACIALIVSFVCFWNASCDSCAGTTCTCDGGVQLGGKMDWSWIWLDFYFVIGVIIGPIILASGINMTSKRAYFKAYPYMCYCPNCKTLGDKRNGVCKNCGAVLDENGDFKNTTQQNAQSSATFSATSNNPYEAYWASKSKPSVQQQAPTDVGNGAYSSTEQPEMPSSDEIFSDDGNENKDE